MKMFKRISAFFFSIVLMVSILPGGYAEEKESESVFHICNADDLRELAQNCSTDRWSENKTFILDCDIDLSGTAFSPIPVFCGTFDGNGHTIRNFTLGMDGSHQGLFRYIRKGAAVKNVAVFGCVEPDGSRCQVGGIAGTNEGSIIDCSFHGNVSGLNYIGGIAGENSGIIENCSCSGCIDGKRFTGGIAGNSAGLIKSCSNSALINTRVTEGSLELNNLNLTNFSDTFNLINAEDTDIVSDSGGIAGLSNGIILDCTNTGKVGYQHYGYNVGGIAGRQSGYISGCRNDAEILGRKDVAGICGQMEPFLIIKNKQTLTDELNKLTDLISIAVGNIGDGASTLVSALDAMRYYTEAAFDDITGVTLSPDEPESPPEGGDPIVPEPETEPGKEPEPEGSEFPELDIEDIEKIADEIDRESLKENLDGLTDEMEYFNIVLGDYANVTAGDLQNVNYQASTCMVLLSNALSGNYSVSLYEDISDVVNEDDIDGKVSFCINNGSVEGDMYVGGITGTMGIEYEFDMEGVIHSAIQNLTEKEEISAVTYQTKCLCISDINNAHIASKKQCAGGIAGESNVGIIAECENYGNVESDSGQYVGGVAGKSSTVINNCCSMCALFGKEYVGGIAGLGKDISGCSSLIKIEGVTACCGAIAGYVNLNGESTVENNSFVSDDLQGIDGISYEGIAQKVDYLEFTENRQLPQSFKKLSVSFIADEEIVKEIELDYGESVNPDLVPNVPEKAGFTGRWEEFEGRIVNSCEVRAIYARKKDTIESERLRDGTQRPLFILSGDFEEGTQLLVEKYTESVPKGEKIRPVEAWKVTLDGTDNINETNRLRYYIPQDLKKYSLFCLNGSGEWEETPFEDFGNYAGIQMPEREIIICSVEKIDFWSKWKSVMN